MKAARFLPPLLAGATLILLGANALPTAKRKHRLQEEQTRLVRELRSEDRRMNALVLEIEALRGDPFYLERMLIETWGGMPEGAEAFTDAHEDPGDPIED